MPSRTSTFAVIDYHLAGGQTGADIARDIHAIRPQVRLLMLTGDPKVPQSARQSADAVLIKGSAPATALLDLVSKLLLQQP